jgi:hypothetical protein
MGWPAFRQVDFEQEQFGFLFRSRCDEPLSSYFCRVESRQLLVADADGSAFEDVEV